MLPFDKSRIFPYPYRHSYVQRHADAGVAPDVLKELMDHSDLKTTQTYYRVSEERRREAVDRVVALQFDRNGNRVWRKAPSLLESEHVRRAIGEVSVPYGVCQEPSNVATGGQSCPSASAASAATTSALTSLTCPTLRRTSPTCCAAASG
jgi:hypothetical protein